MGPPLGALSPQVECVASMNDWSVGCIVRERFKRHVKQRCVYKRAPGVFYI